MQLSGSSDSDSDDEILSSKKCKEEILGLRAKLKEHPRDYTALKQLVDLLRISCEFDSLRSAREAFSLAYPLTTDMWLQWVEDEERMAQSDSEKQYIIDLLKRSFEDYTSVSLRLKYIQLIQAYSFVKSPADLRSHFEDALSVVGFNVQEGAQIWAVYADYESKQVTSAKTGDVKNAVQRARGIYHRWIAAPLAQGDLALKCYREFEANLETSISEDSSKTSIEKAEKLYSQAQLTLRLLQPLEDEVQRAKIDLASFDSSKHNSKDSIQLMKEKKRSVLSAWTVYTNAEINNENHERICCVFERAISACPLNDTLWLRYSSIVNTWCFGSNTIDHINSLDYLTRSPPSVETSAIYKNKYYSLLKRAVRNCTWNGTLWVLLLQCMEMMNCSPVEMNEMLSKSLQQSLSSYNDYTELYLYYCSYYRRRLLDLKSKTAQLTSLATTSNIKKYTNEMRKAFQEAISFVNKSFPAWEEGLTAIERCWATAEVNTVCDVKKAKSIWENIVARRPYEFAIWAEYAHLIQRWNFSGSDCLQETRNIWIRALEAVTDFPKETGDAWLSFERDVGTLKDLEHARVKVSMQKKIWESTLQWNNVSSVTEKTLSKEKKKMKSKQKSKCKKGKKRSAEGNIIFDNEQVEEHTRKRAKVCESNKDSKINMKSGNNKDSKTDTNSGNKSDVIHPERGGRTLFAKNLHFDTTESDLRTALDNIENSMEKKSKSIIGQVRIVTNKYTGRGKGYAYIDFSTPEDASAFLFHFNKGPKVIIKERPLKLLISKQVGAAAKHDNVVYHPCTLFVSDLEKSCTEEDLRKHFEGAGPIEYIHLVCNYHGKSKGYALVQYISSKSIEKALKFKGSKLCGYPIEVARSKFPAIKEKSTESRIEQNEESEESKKESKLKVLALVPRTMRRKSQRLRRGFTAVGRRKNTSVKNEICTKEDTSTEEKSFKNLKQSDFRALLLKGQIQ